MELENKVAIITGGCSGIGYAAAEKFLEEGAKVAVADYNLNGEEAIKPLKEKYGDDVAFVRVDVSKEEEIENMVTKTVELYGKVDIAVASAGIPGANDIINQDIEGWHKILSVDLDGVFLTDKHVINQILKQGTKGSIVNIASIGGLVAFPEDVTYCAAKGAVVNMTRSAAVRVADKGIRINTLAPGVVYTPLVDMLAPEVVKAYENRYPMKRFASPEEVAEAILFLASDRSSYITATTLVIDGGFTAV